MSNLARACILPRAVHAHNPLAMPGYESSRQGCPQRPAGSVHVACSLRLVTTPGAASRRPRRSGLGGSPATAALPDGAEDIPDAMKADLERFQRQRQASSSDSAAPQRDVPAGSSGASDNPAPSSGGLKEVVDKVLIADFFFVLAGLAWLVVGLGTKAAADNSAVLDTWLSLWPTLFQPAIGLLMAGALVSGGIGWMQRRE